MKADTEKCSLNICWFISFFVHFQFYLKILHSLTAVSESVSGTGSRACSTVGVLSRFFVGNILLLNSLKTFSLASKNNLMLFGKYLLSTDFTYSGFIYTL